MSQKRYLDIVAHYEACLEQHGDTHLGVAWPNAADARRRYEVMLDVVGRDTPGENVSLLDFGCGTAHLYEHMIATGVVGIDYAGLDLSDRFIAVARRKFPAVTFYCADLLEDDRRVPSFDYVVLNGVFTLKTVLKFDDMLAYFEQLLTKVWAKTRRGLAFNVMSVHVDWERDDLFHLPFDTLAALLTARLTRNFVIRNDYGLYEYTTYVYR